MQKQAPERFEQWRYLGDRSAGQRRRLGDEQSDSRGRYQSHSADAFGTREASGRRVGDGDRAGDKELDDALEDFDGGILAERDVIRARSNEAAGNAGIPASGPSTQLPGGSDGTSSTTSADVASAPRGIPAQRSAPPAPKAGAAGTIPEDIPDAKDDDIIARQLREAAMNESDPELREKLWEEYRRYKGA